MSRSADPHDYDLDEILSDGSRRGGRSLGRRTVLVGLLGLALIAVALQLLLFSGRAPLHEDQVVSRGMDGTLRTLIDADGDWIGTVLPGIPGLGTQVEAMKTCRGLAATLALKPGETLTLLDQGGVTLAECER